MNSAQIKCDLGTETFVLPQSGIVEIEVEVRYTVVTPTGAAAGLNLLGELGYKINKKSRAFFHLSEIRYFPGSK